MKKIADTKSFGSLAVITVRDNDNVEHAFYELLDATGKTYEELHATAKKQYKEDCETTLDDQDLEVYIVNAKYIR